MKLCATQSTITYSNCMMILSITWALETSFGLPTLCFLSCSLCSSQGCWTYLAASQLKGRFPSLLYHEVMQTILRYGPYSSKAVMVWRQPDQELGSWRPVMMQLCWYSAGGSACPALKQWWNGAKGSGERAWQPNSWLHFIWRGDPLLFWLRSRWEGFTAAIFSRWVYYSPNFFARLPYGCGVHVMAWTIITWGHQRSTELDRSICWGQCPG